MKKLRLMAAILVFVTLVAGSSISTHAFIFSQTITADMDEHWAEDDINTLKSLGIMNGYDGRIHPDRVITRSEFAALITRAFNLKSGDTPVSFTDVGTEHEFYDNIYTAASHGLINGFPDGTFRPDANITREQIVLIISRLYEDSAEYQAGSFGDIPKNYLYKRELYKVCSLGIISGYPDNTFRPNANITRSEIAAVILRTMNVYLKACTPETAIAAAENFILNHYANTPGELIGSALSDRGYIDLAYSTAASEGYTVTNKISNINFLTFDQKGPFSETNVAYDVELTVNNYTRSYKAKSNIKLVTYQDKTLVYEHTNNILHHDRINLTWEIYQAPPSYETPGVNVVSPTCFQIATDTSGGGNNELIYSCGENEFYLNSTLTDSYVKYAQNKGYEIWAMYKSDFSTKTASDFLNNPTARQEASKMLVRQILKYNLEGINFDFENMYHTDKSMYTNHVKEIALICHVLGAKVSVDVNKYEPTSLTWSMCYDRDALAKYSDYIMLMAYDQYYSGSSVPGPVASLDWTENIINLTLKEVPAEKLVLGMPYYIRYWECKNGKVASSKALSMATALEYINTNNAKSEYNSKYKLTKYSWHKDGYECMLWLETAESTRQRVALANKYGLPGVASWRRGFETADVWPAISGELWK